MADSAFADHDGLRADFRGQAELRFVDFDRPEHLTHATKGADAVVVTLQRLTVDLIDGFDSTVRAISRAGVGLDSIDLVAAESAGLAVINQPAYAAPEVASHALALLLAVQRQLLLADAHVRAGWPAAAGFEPIRPLDELAVGVIGCGRIGNTFARYVAPLVREVMVYDPGPVTPPPFVTRVTDLDELLTRSDVVSLHLPLGPGTRGLLGRRELDLLPPGAVVINVARGGILDEDIVAQMLFDGRLAGAGLDVFQDEPLPPKSPLLAAPRTVFSPHSASVSIRAAHRLSRWSISDALAYLSTGTVRQGAIVLEGRRRATAADLER